MKQLKTMWHTGLAIGLAAMPQIVLAQKNPFETAGELAGNVGKEAGLGTEPKPLQEIVGQIINIALGFLGIVLLAYLLYAGFLWMTAGGDEGQVKKAKMMISQAVVGLIVIVAAFAISTFVLGSLVNATSN